MDTLIELVLHALYRSWEQEPDNRAAASHGCPSISISAHEHAILHLLYSLLRPAMKEAGHAATRAVQGLVHPGHGRPRDL